MDLIKEEMRSIQHQLDTGITVHSVPYLEGQLRYYLRCEKYDRIIRKIRQRLFDYSFIKYNKATRIIHRIQVHNAQREHTRRSIRDDRRLNPQNY